jgi:hypothetical protein
MSDFLGDADFHATETLQVSSEETYDVVNGFSTRLTYKGTEEGLRAFANAYNSNGYTATLSQREGRWELVVHMGGTLAGGTPEQNATPTDKWTISRDYATESLWANAKLLKWASLLTNLTEFPGRMTTEDVISDVRRACENGVKGQKRVTRGNGTTTEDVYEPFTNGVLLPGETGFPAGGLTDRVYRQYVLGMETYEIERLALSRVRTYPISYLQRIQLEAVPIVYTTNQMADPDIWAVPEAIYTKLPVDPTQKPPNTIWAWKMRRNNMDVRWDGRTEEVTDWVYAAWSTLTHRVYGEVWP